MAAVPKAHGIKPEWQAYGWTALPPQAWQSSGGINLHGHDLRHEYASRLVEKCVPLAIGSVHSLLECGSPPCFPFEISAYGDDAQTLGPSRLHQAAIERDERNRLSKLPLQVQAARELDGVAGA